MENPQLLLDSLPVPACVFDVEAKKILHANQAFARFTGYGPDELLAGKILLENIVYKKDFKNIYRRLQSLPAHEYLSDDVRLMSKGQRLKEATMAIGQAGDDACCAICLFYETGHWHDLARELRGEIAQERQKVQDTAKAILRTERIFTKLHHLPLLQRELWKCKTIPELLEKAVRFLSHRGGAKYLDISVFLQNEDYLEIGFSSREWALKKFHLQKQHKFAQVARENKMVWEENGECLLPILSPVGSEGVMVAVLEETERALIAENESVRQAHSDLLEAVAQILGLSLYCIRLRQEHEGWDDKDRTTGLYNRKYLWQKIQEYSSDNVSFVLILIAIDGCNRLGWEQSQQQVQDWASLLETHQPAQAILSMIGYGEFGLLLRNKSLTAAANWVEQLKQKLKKLSRTQDAPEQMRQPLCTISGGIVAWDSGYRDAATLWSQAMSCLEQAKNQGDAIFYWCNGYQKVTKRISTKLR